MAYVPDVCYEDAKHDLVSAKGQIKHAALTLYGYYCRRRNKQTGLCLAKLKKVAEDTGIPKTNVLMLRDYLEDVGWILNHGNDVIRPLKGFYPEEKIINWRVKRLLTEEISVLIIRTLVLNNRTLVLIIRTLFKGNLNQQILPANITSFSADSPEANSADTNFDSDLKNGVSPQSGETTPKVQINETGVSPERAETTPDKRSNHPAIKMVKEISGRFPHKDQWDLIISEIGTNPDLEFFQACWRIWRSFDGKPTNVQGWLLLPNKSGKMPEIFKPKAFAENGEKPPDKEWRNVGKFDDSDSQEQDLDKALEILLEVKSDGHNLEDYRKHFSEDDWRWLMEQLGQNND